MSALLHRLELRVVLLERPSSSRSGPFIDGTDLAGLVGDGSGFDPDAQFRDDGAALLRVDTARRVAIYQCGCGGCGCGCGCRSFAGVVEARDDTVILGRRPEEWPVVTNL